MKGGDDQKRKEMQIRVGVIHEMCDEMNWWVLKNTPPPCPSPQCDP